MRLLLDCRLAGLEMDAVQVEAALDVERLRHGLAAVLLLELLGRLRLARRGQPRQRQTERQGSPAGPIGTAAASAASVIHRFIGRSFRSRVLSVMFDLP